MKQKVSDYIAEYIAQWGIRDVFTVTGGGAMHMNDAFGHHKMLHCTYPVSYTHLTLPTT
mgnify:CR=1 FL=1